MTNQQCPNCGAEMKLIPQGISKRTGKPYNAFFSCPECKETMNIPTDIVKKLPTQTNQITQFTKDKNERIERLHNDTKESINWGLAWKLATSLVSNHPLYKDNKIVEMRNAIKNWQTWYYRNITQQEEKDEITDYE